MNKSEWIISKCDNNSSVLNAKKIKILIQINHIPKNMNGTTGIYCMIETK